jgi:choline monooxygenase
MENRFQISNQIESADTLSSDFYTDDHIFESSKETIFSNSWQLITDTKSLQNNNQYPFTLLDGFLNEPLVLTQKNDKIRCFSNVCTHRAHIVCLDACDSSILRCRYHGRTFELDGKMKTMPGFDTVKNFPSEKDDLSSIYSMVWRDFIFVSLNNKIDISSVFTDIEHRLQGYEFDKLVLSQSKSTAYIIDSHWALYCENYLEEFHIPFVHKGLTKDIILDEYQTTLLELSVLQTAVCSNGDNAIDLNDSAPDSDKKIYAYYYWIFPNLMLNFYAWGLSINIIEPLGKSKTRIKYLTYTLPHKKQPNGDDADVDTVEMEDQEVVQSVHQGVSSRYYETGRYSAKFETGVHHFHKLIASILN